MSGKNFPRRGEVYWVRLGPSVGSEIKKMRPCLVVSNDIINEMSDVIIVAPASSRVKKVYSCEVKTHIGKKTGKIMLHQIGRAHV
jgi:mRNA interferase MazF